MGRKDVGTVATVSAAVLLLSAAMSLPVSAGVYKWTDENGQVHYGEAPPPSVSEAKRMTIDKAPPSSANAKERLQQYQQEWDASMEQRAKRQQAEEKAAKNEEIRQKNCETARKGLKQFDTASRMFYQNENGERAYVDDKQRAEEKKQAQELVDKWCQ